MCTCIHKSKRQNIVLNKVNQKPVRPDMAFPKTMESPSQFVISILSFQGYASTQCIDNFIQQGKIKATLFHQLIASLISCGEFERIYHSASKAARRSSMLA